ASESGERFERQPLTEKVLVDVVRKEAPALDGSTAGHGALIRRAVEEHEALGLADGKRAEQQRVEDGEDCGVGADPERERERRERGEGGMLPQEPRAEADVFQPVHGTSSFPLDAARPLKV